MTCTRCGNERSKRYALPLVMVDRSYLDEGTWEEPAQYLDLCTDCVGDVKVDLRMYVGELKYLESLAMERERTPLATRVVAWWRNRRKVG